MRTVLARLTEGDLVEWRVMWAEYHALQLNPAAFSAGETTRLMMRYARLLGDFVERYGLEPGSSWDVSPFSGAIYTED